MLNVFEHQKCALASAPLPVLSRLPWRCFFCHLDSHAAHPRSLARLLYVCCFSVFQRSFLVKILWRLSMPVFLLLTPRLPPQGRIKVLYSVLSTVKIDSVPPMPFLCVCEPNARALFRALEGDPARQELEEILDKRFDSCENCHTESISCMSQDRSHQCPGSGCPK